VLERVSELATPRLSRSPLITALSLRYVTNIDRNDRGMNFSPCRQVYVVQRLHLTFQQTTAMMEMNTRSVTPCFHFTLQYWP
jgi:hypothetical protein